MSSSSLTLLLAHLPRALGSMLHQDLVWVTPDDLGTPSMSAAPGVPLDMSVDFTSVEDGVPVQLATSMDLIGECVCCLDEVRDHHDVSSAEVYFEASAPTLTPSEDDEEVEDPSVIGEHDTVDIETQLRDAIVPLVDPRPLRSEDCAGLRDVCGEKRADLPSDHEHFVVDPRLASLTSLLGNDIEPRRS